MPPPPWRQYLSMLWILAWTDFKLRYYGSYLGYVWSLLKPLALFGVLYFVFSVLMHWDVPYYQLYLLLGIILWNFFAESTSVGVTALSNKIHIVKKIYFPRFLVILASSLSNLIGFVLNLAVFFIFMLIAQVGLSFHILFFVLLMVLFYIFTVGISFFLSALYILFRDINQVWEVFLQAFFWLTPVVYPLDLVPEHYKFFLFLNPVTGFIQYSRLLLIDHQLPSFAGMGYLVIWSGAMLAAGFWFFQQIQRRATEVL